MYAGAIGFAHAEARLAVCLYGLMHQLSASQRSKYVNFVIDNGGCCDLYDLIINARFFDWNSLPISEEYKPGSLPSMMQDKISSLFRRRALNILGNPKKEWNNTPWSIPNYNVAPEVWSNVTLWSMTALPLLKQAVVILLQSGEISSSPARNNFLTLADEISVLSQMDKSSYWEKLRALS
jgi:hypothetical protein